MRYVEIYAKRSHLELNKKQTYKELLEKYKGKEYYVSFQGITKLGINPRPRAYDTSIGVYTFPLEYIYTDEFDRIVSYQIQEQPYVFVLKNKSNKVLNVSQDIPNYEKQLEKLTDIVKECGINVKPISDEKLSNYEVVRFLKDHEMKPVKTGGKLYALACYYADLLVTNGNKKFGRRYCYIIHHILTHLGYEVIKDDGDGIIHHREPTQTLFLTKKAFSIITMENNTRVTNINSWGEVFFYSKQISYKEQNNKTKYCTFILDAIKSALHKPTRNKSYIFNLSFPDNEIEKNAVNSIFIYDALEGWTKESAYTFLYYFIDILDSNFIDQAIAYLLSLEYKTEDEVKDCKKKFIEMSKKYSLVPIKNIKFSNDIEKTVKAKIFFRDKRY